MKHAMKLLGKTLSELAPLITEAMAALDKPGTRALRRKIDKGFHYAVGTYGIFCREDAPMAEWDHMALPHYERATPVWPGRVACEARMARAAAVPSAPPSLRVVVDNTMATAARIARRNGGSA